MRPTAALLGTLVLVGLLLASVSTAASGGASGVSLRRLLETTPAASVDLHSHTVYSDGSDTPEDVVRLAIARGLKVLAITDHDQLRYSREAREIAHKAGLTLIQGVEVSCEWSFAEPELTGRRESKVHLLGYFTTDDPPSPLKQLLEELQEKRDNRNQVILDRLREFFGFQVSMAEVEAEAGEGVFSVGRPHIAQVLIKKGYARDINDVFTNYMHDDALKLDKWSLDVADAIHAIHEHGGVPVLAHPQTLKISSQALLREVGHLLRRAPLAGIECYSSRHSWAQAEEYRQVAEAYGLLVTGGSDYHGSNKQGVDLGVSFGEATAAWNQQAWERYQALRFTHDVKRAQSLFSTAAGRIGIKLLTYGALALAIYTLVRLYQQETPVDPFAKRLHQGMHGFAPLRWMCDIPLPVLGGSGQSGSPPAEIGLDRLENGRAAPATAALGPGGAPSAVGSPGQGAPAAVVTEPKGPGLGAFLACTLGLQLCYLTWGYFQERIMTQGYGPSGADRFEQSEFLVFVNRFSAIFFALGLAYVQEPPRNFSPRYKFFVASLSNVVSSWFQYEALKFVSFPLQVLSKSSKILFSMLMGRFLWAQRFPWTEYMVAGLVSVGILVYKLNEQASAAHQRSAPLTLLASGAQTLGLVLLAGYVLSDAFTGQWQSSVFRQHKISSTQMMLGTNVFSAALAGGMLLVRGEFWGAVGFTLAHPDFMFHLLLMSLFSAAGQLFIFYTINKFGAVVFSSIMTARQLFSILISVYSFGHQVSGGGYLGLTMVFGALVWQIWLKNKGGSKQGGKQGGAPAPKRLRS